MKKKYSNVPKEEVSENKDKNESDDNTDSMYLKEMKEELNKAALEFRSGETEGKKDTKLDKMFKLINMIKLSSTIKILKDDNSPVEIIPHLFLGSIGSASNLKQLQNFKITHIICCAKGVQNFFPDNFKYLNINLLDSQTEPIKKHFEESNKFIDDAIQNKGNVLIHCHAGISRSSSILIAYIMKTQKMSLDKVLELIRAKRDKVKPNDGFIEQLKEYEK